MGIPYLNQDALDLLSNCCTSKESDLWMSLGSNWTQTIDASILKASRLPSSFQPIFSDGWAPVIGELELIGLVAPSSLASSAATTDSRDFASSAEICLPTDSRQHHSSSRSRDTGRKTSNHQLDEPPAGSSSNRYALVEHSSSNYPLGPRSNRSNGIKSSPQQHHQAHKTGRGLEHRRRSANAGESQLPPDSLAYQHSHIDAHHLIDPYLNKVNPVPYGYPQDPSIELEPDQDPRNYYRLLEQQKRTGHSVSSMAGDNQNFRNSNSRQDPTKAQPYDPILEYPAHEQPPFDLAQQRHSSKLHGRLPYPTEDHIDARYDSRDYNGRLRDYPSSSQHNSRERKTQDFHKQPYQSRTKEKHNFYQHHSVPPEVDYLDETDHEAMLLDLGPAQTEWFYELQSRGALIVRVLFTREANNDKELSVKR